LYIEAVVNSTHSKIRNKEAEITEIDIHLNENKIKATSRKKSEDVQV
jgi:hypothetical protein